MAHKVPVVPARLLGRHTMYKQITKACGIARQWYPIRQQPLVAVLLLEHLYPLLDEMCYLK